MGEKNDRYLMRAAYYGEFLLDKDDRNIEDVCHKRGKIKVSSDKDVNPYQPDNIPLFEVLYGKHLISLGGFSAIDNMFSGLSIQNKKALDIGFGLGGVAFYLAEKYQMHICGVEIHEWMAQHAKEQTPEQLRNRLDFCVYDQQGNIPFAENGFDLAYSKGVLNHVHGKLPLFKNIYFRLKKDGYFVIADWVYPEMEKFKSRPLVKESENSYIEVLQKAGFSDIKLRNDSKLFITYVESFLNNLAIQRHFIERNFGKELFTTIQKDHITMLEDIKQGQKIAVRIVVQKKSTTVFNL